MHSAAPIKIHEPQEAEMKDRRRPRSRSAWKLSTRQSRSRREDTAGRCLLRKTTLCCGTTRRHPRNAAKKWKLGGVPSAITLAPTYADAYAIRPSCSARFHEANRLMASACSTGGQRRLRRTIARYRSVLRSGRRFEAVSRRRPIARMGNALAHLDWSDSRDRLTRKYCVLIPKLLDALTCAAARDVRGRSASPKPRQRIDLTALAPSIFRAPIPPEVDEPPPVYPHVVSIANHWQELLCEPERFPAQRSQFRDLCVAAGQSTPTPIL